MQLQYIQDCNIFNQWDVYMIICMEKKTFQHPFLVNYYIRVKNWDIMIKWPKNIRKSQKNLKNEFDIQQTWFIYFLHFLHIIVLTFFFFSILNNFFKLITRSDVYICFYLIFLYFLNKFWSCNLLMSSADSCFFSSLFYL